MLKFWPDHWCADAWEWQIRSKQKAFFDGVESVERDGELLLWWAPPDELERAAAEQLSQLPSSSMLWETARKTVEDCIRNGGTFDSEACLKMLRDGETIIPNVAVRWHRQAEATEWAHRRRKLQEPPRDAFIRDDLVPFDWGVGIFESDWERWPVLNEVVDKCASNISSAAWLAYEHIRYDTEVGGSLTWEDGAPTTDQTTADTPIVTAATVDEPIDQPPERAKPNAANANARMLDTLDKRPESKDWTAEQFAQHLGYSSKGTIASTKTWKTLMQTREEERRDRMERNQ